MRLRQTGQGWIVHTPAKLNLFLEVLGKRADGYHDLETVMVAVNMFDTLIFNEEPTENIFLRCHHSGSLLRRADATGDEVPDGRDNLAVRAAELLRARCGVQRGINIKLLKRIPAAAGLAGGSSDAAAVIFALNQIWDLGLRSDELQGLASEIGSDVSFFLSPTPLAVCQGRGEILRPLHSPLRLHFVIARPDSGLSTALVFKHCRPEANPRGASELVTALQSGDLQRVCSRMHNSLQQPAESLNSDIDQLKHVFSRLPLLGHMMTGSGTAYFGICQNRRQAMTAAARLRATGLSRVFVAESPP